MTQSVDRLPLEGGGEIVFEVVPGTVHFAGDGPVKAGRIADAARRVPQTLQAALGPVREMTHTVVTQLREAGPAEVEVEFGLNLSGQAGVILNKGEATAHLKIRALWRSEATAGDNA